MSGPPAPLRVGLVGVGSMGRHHARILSALEGVALAGLHNQDPDRAAEIAAAAGTRAHTSLRTLLAEGLDVAVVAVPTSAHAEVALACLEAGCAVLVEKPIAASVDEARTLIEAARSRGLALMVGHVERFNPAMRALRRAVGDERVLALHATRASPYPTRLSDVGVILDLGVHDIDLVRWVAGAELRVVGAAARPGPDGRDSLAVLQLRSAAGALAQVHLSWHSPVRVRRFEVTTDRALITADLIARTVTRRSAGADGAEIAEPVAVDAVDPLEAELAEFVGAVRSGRSPMITGEDGMAALEIALACLAEARRGWAPAEAGSRPGPVGPHRPGSASA